MDAKTDDNSKDEICPLLDKTPKGCFPIKKPGPRQLSYRSNYGEPAKENGLDPHASGYTTLPNTTFSSPQLWASCLAFVGMLIGAFIASADTSFVLGSFSTIGSSFGESSSASSLVTSYTLGNIISQPLYGKMSDLFGCKPVLLFAYCMFAAGTAGSGLMTSFDGVVAGRFAAGLGASGIISLISIIIADSVPTRDIAVWRSYVYVAVALGRSSGSPLGGLLTDLVGWRWSFLGQVPIILGIMTPVASFQGVALYSDRPSESSVPRVKAPLSQRITSIDLGGSLSLGCASITLVVLLDILGRTVPWSHPLVSILSGCFLIFTTIFVLVEGFVAAEPILPNPLWKRRGFVLSCVSQGLQQSAQIALTVSVPNYSRVTTDATDAQAALREVPAMIGNMIGGVLTGYLIKRTGKYKLAMLFSSVLGAAAYLFITLQCSGNTSSPESTFVFFTGFSLGMQASSSFVALGASVPPPLIAVATSAFFLFTNLGTLFGVSISSSILQAIVRRDVHMVFPENPKTNEIVDQVSADLGALHRLPEAIKTVVIKSFVRGLQYSVTFSIGASILAALATMRLQEQKLNK